MGDAGVTILTLKLDSSSQAYFDALRKRHFPPERNRIPAHLTLFHALPATAEVREVLQAEADSVRSFPMRVARVASMGHGVAFFLESPQLQTLHRLLSQSFEPFLNAQDRMGFRPHVVVQNKVAPDEAKTTLTRLEAQFTPFNVQAEGLGWWNYLGGPWKWREGFDFAP